MQFKKNRAILAAVVAAAMSSSMLMSTAASAAVTNKYGDDTYKNRFLSLYENVIPEGEENGYLSSNGKENGGFGIPYHSVEELICEAPDYGHETTSEAMSYIVWIAAMHDRIAGGSDLAKAWKTLENMIPAKDQQTGFFAKSEVSAQTAKEWPEGFGLDGDPNKCGINMYPSEGSESNTGKNPIHSELTSAYRSEGREYLMHWLADVDDWYGFGGSARGTKGKFTYINTFNRGDQESCFETIPHPSIEDLTYGNKQQGMKFAFQKSTAKSWSYTNAPDAEDRAIQAIYAANRWKVGSSDLSEKAGMMGDFCRNDMFDKYYKAIGCQSFETQNDGRSVGKEGGQHYLMSWYTAWGGAQDGTWAWQIGCSHSHQFYQNPLAAYGLLYDADLNKGMKTSNATKDYTTSLERQIEMYLWLQSADGPFAGGCTNSWNGKYEKYPSNVAKFYDMAYVEHPVYADPGSNHWTGNQFWSTQRLAELYYLIKTDGDKSSAKPGGMSLEKALETLLDNWVKFFSESGKVELKGDDFSVPATLDWSGQPADWSGTYSASANSNLHCEITAMGNSDLGCAASLADTLVYYAKAKGAKVNADGSVSNGTSLEQNALYTAKELMDRAWKHGRDEIGISRPEHNGSLARFFEQEVWIPKDASGKYPYGKEEVTNGAKFIDLRPQYEDVEGFDKLKKAWEADVANGAKYDNTKSDCSQFTNVEGVELHFHRFWHVGDVLMTLGTFDLLYPEMIPDGGGVVPDTTTTTTTTTTSDTTGGGKTLWGDVDCSGDVKIADAVLLARYVAEDKVTVTAQGKINADCYDAGDSKLTAEDTGVILKYLAGLTKQSELPEKA
jgi:hypothetical protein